MSWKQYTIVGIGSALAFTGMLQILRTMGNPKLAFGWGAVGIAGVLVLAYGIIQLLTRQTGQVRDVNPEGALRTTDSRDRRQ